MATSATTTAAVFSSFSNNHISGKGRRLGQGGTSHPINSHAIQNSLSGSHQQRKRRRRQRKAAAAAAAERNKLETINNSEDSIDIHQCRQMNKCGKSGSNDKNQDFADISSLCDGDCNCSNISSSLLASLVALPREKKMGENSNCCQESLLEKSGTSQSVKMQYLPKSGMNNSIKTYSNPSAPMFGNPSSHDNVAPVFRNTDVDHSIEINGFASDMSAAQNLPNSCTLSRVPPLINSPELQLRFLNPTDIPEVKRLCREWFPIEYPDVWYTDITSNHKFYSVCAVYRCQIIGLIVAEIKETGNLPKEDSEILGPDNICPSLFGKSNRRNTNQRLGYILSLGVVKEFRKNGIASFLLDNLVAHLTNPYNDPPTDDVHALYLHVLTTNSQAIAFYEHRGFRAHMFLPYYYAIKGRRRDGFTYVLYLNGGHPPWSLIDYAGHCLQATFYGIVTLQPVRKWLNFPVFITRSLLRKLTGAAFAAAAGGGGNQRLAAAGGGVGYAINGANGGQGVWPRIRQIAHSSTAAVFTS